MAFTDRLHNRGSISTGYDVDNSVKFDKGNDSTTVEFFERNVSTTTNRYTATFSAWIKKTDISTAQYLFTFGNVDNDNGRTFARFQADQTLRIMGGNTTWLNTVRVFRDTSAWYHIVVAQDSSLGTAADRVKFYVNGELITSFGTNTQIGQNVTGDFNGSGSHQIGAYNGGDEFQGYFSQICFVDNAQYNPTSFAEFDEDSGIWKPIDVSGLSTGGTSFFLDFEDSSALGNDAAGSNNFTVNNLTAIDQSTDTCTNNFATLNPLDVYASKTGTLSEGNLKLTVTASQVHTAVGTIAPSSGKWYLEVELDAKSGSNNSNVGISDLARDDKSNMPSKKTWGYGYNPDGTKQNNGSDSSYGDSYTAGDILGVAMDLDNGAVYFSKNGTFQASGDPTSGASKTNAAFTWTPDASMTWAPYVADNTSGVAFTWITNFGNPIVTGTDQTDGNSRGSFEYAVPSGYLSLCTKNLASTG